MKQFFKTVFASMIGAFLSILLLIFLGVLVLVGSIMSLSKEDKVVLVKKINKSDFNIKDTEFNQYSIIKYVEFINEKDGHFLFKATLNIPDTDWVEKIKFSIQKDNPEKIKLL